MEEIQRLINQEAWAIMGCFQTTNLGALSMESGLRAATVQLQNRQWRIGLQILSLPLGDQTWEVPQQESGGGLQTPLYIADRLRAQFCWRSWKPSTRSYCKRRKLRQKQRQIEPDLG